MENMLGNTAHFFRREYSEESCRRGLSHVPAQCTVWKLCELYEFFFCLNTVLRKKESPHIWAYTTFYFRAILTDR
jgi:hypothetical protein